MTQSEAEKVMMEERSVKCKGIEYRKIDSVITRKRDGKKYVQIALLDKGGNSITVDDASAVEEIKQEVEIPF